MKNYPAKARGVNIRRRHIDRRVFAIRHNDGLKDIYLKLKQKAREAIDYFKALPGGKKVAILIGSAVAVCGAILASKSAGETKKEIDELENLRRAIDENGRLVYENQMKKALQYTKNKVAAESLKARSGFSGAISAGKPVYANAPVLSANLTPKEAKVYQLAKVEQADLSGKMKIQTIVGLLGIFAGAAGAIFAAKA